MLKGCQNNANKIGTAWSEGLGWRLVSEDSLIRIDFLLHSFYSLVTKASAYDDLSG
jgi:hypothetical protein